jgi:hypothetical protein
MESFRERPRKLIHKELLNQDLDTLTYKDIRNISRNLYKARSSQMFPLPIDTEETHETLSSVQLQTISKGQFLLLNDSRDFFYVFLQNQLTVS